MTWLGRVVEKGSDCPDSVRSGWGGELGSGVGAGAEYKPVRASWNGMGRVTSALLTVSNKCGIPLVVPVLERRRVRACKGQGRPPPAPAPPDHTGLRDHSRQAGALPFCISLGKRWHGPVFFAVFLKLRVHVVSCLPSWLCPCGQGTILHRVGSQ